MPAVAIYNQSGAAVGTIELDPAVFGVAVKAPVLHQVVVAALANARTAIAHTKTRGEVRGGGKKPWRQKGTGRARHGSIRSPLWVGGGTTFGPRRERSFAQKVNTRMRRQALRMALSDVVADARFIVLDAFAPEQGKTAAARRTLDAVVSHAKRRRKTSSVLIVLASDERDAARSFQNLVGVDGMDATHLNAVDVLRHDVLVVTTHAVDRITATFAPVSKNRVSGVAAVEA